jgi:hypothetical protein
MNRYINRYTCAHQGCMEEGQEPCEWEDKSESMNNDKCPTCNAEIEPYESEEIEGKSLPSDPEGKNDARAAAARKVLESFTREFGEREAGHEQNIADMVCDLAHFCDREAIDLKQIMECARAAYGEETDQTGPQFELS